MKAYNKFQASTNAEYCGASIDRYNLWTEQVCNIKPSSSRVENNANFF